MRPFPRRTFLGRFGGAALAPSVVATIAAEVKAKGSPIKIGQIGVGHAHASKLAGLSPVARLRGRRRRRAGRRAAQAGRERSRPSRTCTWLTREQLLNTPGLQAVLVETRVRDLLDNAEACVAAGKHVHLDKPAGESLPQFSRILETAAKQKLLVQMGYMFRYNPAVVLLREFLKQGWLGEPFEVHAVMSKVVAPDERTRAGRVSAAASCSSWAATSSTWSIGILGKPERGHARSSQHASTTRRRTARTTCSPCSTTRGPSPR